MNAVDHLRAAVLTYSDFQRFVRALRAVRTEEAPRGYPLRYIVCGEHGPTGGRTHWHAILFWKEQVPPGIVLYDDQVSWSFWEHGYSYFEPVHYDTARYVTKYIVKALQAEVDQAEGAEEIMWHFMMSKKPPLGAKYFAQLAAGYAEQGIAPQDFAYTFPEVVYTAGKREGQKRRFWLQGASRKLFLRAYRDEWKRLYGPRFMPNSDILEELADSEAAEDVGYIRRLLAGEKIGLYRLNETILTEPYRGVVKKPGADDLRSWMSAERLVFRERLNVWAYRFEGGQADWYFAPDPDTGVWSWRAKIGAPFQPAKEGYSDARMRPIASR